MKRLTWRFVLPLAIVGMAVITKWWYVLPEDAPDSMMLGFPLAYICDGWGSSMSKQLFILELFIDLGTYFLCCLLIVFLLYRYASFRAGKTITAVVWSVAGVIIVSATLLSQVIDVHVKPQRDFKMKVIETGCQAPWTDTKQPVFPEDLKRWNQQ